MKKRMSALSIPFLAVALVAGSCEEDDPMGGGGPPPDLSGSYTLVTFSSPLTGGLTLGPAQGVTGTFTLTQTSVAGSEAVGTLAVDITVPDGQGGTMTIMDAGTFTVRGDGTWQQTGQVVQGSGTFALVGNTLTVIVTEPATAVSTSVWQRQ